MADWEEDEPAEPPQSLKFKADPGFHHANFEPPPQYTTRPTPTQPEPPELIIDDEPAIIVTTDFDPLVRPCKTSSKKTRQRTIFTKNMFQTMPKLVWLPGEFRLMRWNDTDEEAIGIFCHTAASFRIVSLMIYAEVEGTYRIVMFSLSTPLITLVFDLRQKRQSSNRVSLPGPIMNALGDPNVIVVCPGKKDWHFSAPINHLNLLRDLVSPLPEMNLRYIQDFEASLKINRSGKDICEHMKMVHWLFQVKIDVALHGGPVLSVLPTDQWQKFTDLYGKLLIYLFWALCKKQRDFDKQPKPGVNMVPIYLEDLIIERRLSDEKDRQVLRRRLIGNASYPDPPLPDLPVPQ